MRVIQKDIDVTCKKLIVEANQDLRDEATAKKRDTKVSALHKILSALTQLLAIVELLHLGQRQPTSLRKDPILVDNLERGTSSRSQSEKTNPRPIVVQRQPKKIHVDLKLSNLASILGNVAFDPEDMDTNGKKAIELSSSLGGQNLYTFVLGQGQSHFSSPRSSTR